MPKLPEQNQFIDLSDYGRPIARVIATALKNTRITPIHLTIAFIISGIIGIACILYGYFWAAGFFLILKSILDAADGELARVKEKPSYTGRYFDSISDIILNLFILLAIWFITDINFLFTILAFLSIQLQGTLYNYYYVILRNRNDGDSTSRVFENETPIAMKGENQKTVTTLFAIYNILYGIFDNAIYALDFSASKSTEFPNWFMTIVSVFGLGFHLLLISVMLIVGWKDLILPFLIGYSILIFVFIGIRRQL